MKAVLRFLLIPAMGCMLPSHGLQSGEPAVTINDQARPRIVIPDQPGEVERFAAQELQHYLAAIMGGPNFPVVASSRAQDKGDCDILLGRPAVHPMIAHLMAGKLPDGDGYVLRSVKTEGDHSSIVLASKEERGVLFAVYQFLEKLGVRFFGYRDRGGEIVPHQKIPNIPKLDIAEHPAFRYRFVSDNNFNAADKSKLAAVADWAAKNRCNIFMLTPSRPGETWDQIALDEVRKRGLMIAGPGHVLARFTPDRSLFAEHPEYFPMRHGVRTATESKLWGGVPSFCWSNASAMQIVVDNAMRYLDAAPFLDVFAVYPPDGPQHGFQCQCSDCAGHSMSEWYLALMNRIAQAAATRHPRTKIMWISYNECSVPPSHEQPWDHGRNMMLLWCNELRDFAAPMDSESNRHAPAILSLKPRLLSVKTDGTKNPGDTDLAAWHRWQGWSAYLRRNDFAGDVVLLDYYNSHVGKSLRVPMLQHCQSGPWPDGLMKKDFLFYQTQGAAGWQNCTDYFNDLPTPYWNWLAAQLLWNPDANTGALDSDFYAAWFGPAGETMRRYYGALWHELGADHTAAERASAMKLLARELDSAEALIKADPEPARRPRLKAAREFHQRVSSSRQ